MPPRKPELVLFLRFLKFLWAYHWQWLATIALTGLVMLLNLVNPYLTKLVVDKAIVGRDVGLFVVLSVVGGSIFLITILADTLKNFLLRSLKLKVGFDLNRTVYKKIQGLPWIWFQNKSTGEHLYKLSYDADRARDIIVSAPMDMVLIVSQALLTMFIVLRLNWQMACLSIILLPLLYLSYYYFNRRMRSNWSLMASSFERIFKYLQETISHIRLVKVFNKEESGFRRYAQELAENVRLGLRTAKLEVASGFVSQVTSKIIFGCVGFYGIWQVIHGRMTLGTFTAISVYLAQLVGLQSRFVSFFNTAIMGLVSCKRVAAVLDEPDPVAESENSVETAFGNPGIIFKKVSFGYSRDNPVFRDVSFSIKGGSFVALAGHSGSGKSTMMSLILRLYEPSGGEILIDGRNIRNLKTGYLRNQIGIVLQEPLLWNDTVRHNICYGKEDATDEEITVCARMAGAAKFIERLPQGYDTVIGENACKISEGQKQRIAIARALIRKPKILILDEAMSSVDPQNEKEILTNIKEVQKETTIIFISHRLSTVMKAELVYYLRSSDSPIIDNPASLLRNNNDFRALFDGRENEGSSLYHQ